MKKKTLYTLFLLLICIIAGITYGSYQFYAPPCIREPYPMKHLEDTLRIAYIGDSWAFLHKDHNCQIPRFLEGTIHRPVKVHSYGICGLTSKEIYENMYNNTDFKHFLQKRGYEYCFISAGINDSYKKMSSKYYQQSYLKFQIMIFKEPIHGRNILGSFYGISLCGLTIHLLIANSCFERLLMNS